MSFYDALEGFTRLYLPPAYVIEYVRAYAAYYAIERDGNLSNSIEFS
jgi:hypothetical protein